MPICIMIERVVLETLLEGLGNFANKYCEYWRTEERTIVVLIREKRLQRSSVTIIVDCNPEIQDAIIKIIGLGGTRSLFRGGIQAAEKDIEEWAEREIRKLLDSWNFTVKKVERFEDSRHWT